MTTPTFESLLASIGERTAAFVSALTVAPGPLTATVPDCPDWTGRELAHHLGEVHRFWALTVGLGPAEEASEDPVVGLPPADDVELGPWLVAGARDLTAALTAAGPDAGCWVWWGEPATVAAVARHQVVEVAVHAYDAAAAAGVATVEGFADEALALDVIDEFVTIILGAQMLYPSAAWPHGATRVALVPDGDAPGWVVDLGPGVHSVSRGTAENVDVTIAGSPAAIALALHRRGSARDQLRMTDITAGEQFLDWPDLS